MRMDRQPLSRWFLYYFIFLSQTKWHKLPVRVVTSKANALCGVYFAGLQGLIRIFRKINPTYLAYFFGLVIPVVSLSGCQKELVKEAPIGKSDLRTTSCDLVAPINPRFSEIQRYISDVIALDKYYWFIYEPSIPSGSSKPIPKSNRILFENKKLELTHEFKKNLTFGHWLPDVMFAIHNQNDPISNEIILSFINQDRKVPNSYLLEVYLYALLMTKQNFPQHSSKVNQKLDRFFNTFAITRFNYSPLRVMIRRTTPNSEDLLGSYAKQKETYLDSSELSPEEYLQIAEAIEMSELSESVKLVEIAASKRWPRAILSLARIGNEYRCLDRESTLNKVYEYYGNLGASLKDNVNWDDYIELKSEVELISRSEYLGKTKSCK